MTQESRNEPQDVQAHDESEIEPLSDASLDDVAGGGCSMAYCSYAGNQS